MKGDKCLFGINWKELTCSLESSQYIKLASNIQSCQIGWRGQGIVTYHSPFVVYSGCVFKMRLLSSSSMSCCNCLKSSCLLSFGVWLTSIRKTFLNLRNSISFTGWGDEEYKLTTSPVLNTSRLQSIIYTFIQNNQSIIQR